MSANQVIISQPITDFFNKKKQLLHFKIRRFKYYKLSTKSDVCKDIELVKIL